MFWLYNRNLNDRIMHVVNALKNLPNVEWIPLDPDICLKASIIIKEHNLSPFDAYHAATALSRDSTIISTDHIYDKIRSISKIDPRNL